ncbi:DUF3343 domain-containing protein [Clostridium peptidivorans]|uniref:DUF3343 domain-containing protein n=1 Tax=Clostridium peptidivorans TaxID=100174 RepID=UPI000BE23485|nr:DUF3343 domain-containing protein [Clostridium peptidivorans]
MTQYYILVFKNTLDSIKAEKFLKDNSIEITIMPTPTGITQSCGISIKINPDDIDKIKELITENKLTVKTVFGREESAYRRIYNNEE